MINDTTRKNIHVDKANPIPLWGVKELDDVMLKVSLLKDNNPFDVTGQSITLGIQSTAGIFEQNTGITIADKNNIDIRLKNGAIAKQGTCKMDLAFKDANGKMTSASFFMTVDPKVLNDEAVLASDEFDTLTKAVQKINADYEALRGGLLESDKVIYFQDEINKTNKAINNLDIKKADNARIDEIVAHNGDGTKDTEIIDARKGKASMRAKIDEMDLKSESNSTQVTEIKKYNKGSNVDQNGKAHDDLASKLNADYSIIMDRFNKATLLPYESEFINAANSYMGMTKDLVVKGKTLQNLWDYNKQGMNAIKDNGYVKLVSNGAYPLATTTDISMFKPNTLYTLIVDTTEYTIDTNLAVSTGNVRSIFPVISDSITKVGISIHKITTRQSFVGCDWGLQTSLNKATTGQVKFRMIILEGDYTNQPIPQYFEGIKSVNEDNENLEIISCGKNLNKPSFRVGTFNNDGTNNNNAYVTTSTLIKVRSGSVLVVAFKDNIPTSARFILFRDKKNNSMGAIVVSHGVSFTVPSNVEYVIIQLNKQSDSVVTNDDLQILNRTVQLEGGTVVTQYEPYQGHRIPIRMKNLRGIGAICDTGDGVRRIGKVVLNGSELWEKSTEFTLNNTIQFRIYHPLLATSITIKTICDKFISLNNEGSILSNDAEWLITNSAKYMYISILKTKLLTQDLNGFKAWLQTNPTTVYYELATPTIEEGNIEELRTYDGQTNIFSEGSLVEPKISCKVPSNVQAVVMNLRSENEALNNDVNTLQANTEENNLTNIETNLNQEARLTMLELGVI